MLIPITSPARLTSGPPELPGLMAASVWRNFARRILPSSRPLPLMMPALTVVSSSNGLPIAITQSPMSSLSESPSFETGRSWAFSSLMTARSLSGSVLISAALNSRPSGSSTVTVSAPATTWLLVSTRPSLSTITPEPTPERGCVWPPSGWLNSKPSGTPFLKKSSNGVPLKGFSPPRSGPCRFPCPCPCPCPRLAETFLAFVSLRTTTTLGMACSAAWRNALESELACMRASAIAAVSSPRAAIERPSTAATGTAQVRRQERKPVRRPNGACERLIETLVSRNGFIKVVLTFLVETSGDCRQADVWRGGHRRHA